MFRRRTKLLWSERHAGKWNNDNIFILGWSNPLISVFDSHCRRKDWEYFSVFTHAVPYFSPWRDLLCFVTLKHSAQGRLICWLVSLSVCISDFMFIVSTYVFMIRCPLTLPVYLVICHTTPPPPSVFLLSLLLSFAAVYLNTLSLVVMKQKKWLFEKLSIFSPISSAWLREWHSNYEICPLKPSPNAAYYNLI